jgi:hemin uptake protein HemP
MQDDNATNIPVGLPESRTPDLAAPRRICSEDILRGASEIVIDHNGRLYKLRITQNGKLILTA